MRLYILRHGEAQPLEESLGGDEGRILTEHGRETIRLAALGMRRISIGPRWILTSPFPRAAETARIVAEVLGCEGAVQHHDKLRAGTRPGKVLKMLQGLDDPPEDLMLVGHNPDLEDLVGLLIGAPGPSIRLKKGGLAVVQFDAAPAKGTGRLARLWSCRDLGMLGA